MRDNHHYSECEDAGCERFPCRVYREGAEAGASAGQAEGDADGYADGGPEGYADGYADGGE